MTTEPCVTTQPLSDVGRLYKMMKAGEITLEAYVQAIAGDGCATPGCLRPATVIERGANYCGVCAMRMRAARRLG